MPRLEFRNDRLQEHYDHGYDDAIADAVRVIREYLGDRVVNGAWQEGDPRADKIIAALERETPP